MENSDNQPQSQSLYRISDDVKTQMLHALKLWQRSTIVQDRVLIERCFRSLETPYSTSNFVETSTSNIPSNQNDMKNFYTYLLQQVQQSNGDQRVLLEKVQEAFHNIVGGIS